MNDATVRHFIKTDKLVKMLKSKEVILAYPKTVMSQLLFSLLCAVLQGGILVILRESNEKCMLLELLKPSRL